MSDIEVAHRGDRVRVHATGAEGVVTDYVEPWSYNVLLDDGTEVVVSPGGITNLDYP